MNLKEKGEMSEPKGGLISDHEAGGTMRTAPNSRPAFFSDRMYLCGSSNSLSVG